MTFPRIADQHNFATGTDGFAIETAEGQFWDGGFGRGGNAFFDNRALNAVGSGSERGILCNLS